MDIIKKTHDLLLSLYKRGEKSFGESFAAWYWYLTAYAEMECITANDVAFLSQQFTKECFTKECLEVKKDA